MNTKTGITIPTEVAAAPEAAPRPGGGPTRVIVFGNEKGGSGKSTVAMHVVVGLLRAGRRVGTIDVDSRQATLTRYLENRATVAETKGFNLPLPGGLSAGGVCQCVRSARHTPATPSSSVRRTPPSPAERIFPSRRLRQPMSPMVPRRRPS